MISIRNVVFMLVKGIGALALGGAILWQVAKHCGPCKGIVYVHVAKPRVSVAVDAQTHWVETMWETPIVRELEPGSHTLRMFDDGRVVFEQEFTIDAGQELVLIACEGYNPGPSSPCSSRHAHRP